MQKVQCMGIRPLGAHLGTRLVQMPTAGQGPLHGWPSENGVTLLHPQSMCVRPPPPSGAPAGTPPSHDTPWGPASPLLATLQLIQQRDDLSSPSAAQGVAQGYSTPQRVHLLWGEAQLLYTVDSLKGGRAPAVAPSPVPQAPTGRPRPC